MKLRSQFPLIIGLTTTLYACNQVPEKAKVIDSTSLAKSRTQIAAMLDSFNIAAGNADYTNYFNFYADDAIFIGTDATEHWDKKAFMQWAKPAFDKKKPGISNPLAGTFILARMERPPGLMNC